MNKAARKQLRADRRKDNRVQRRQNLINKVLARFDGRHFTTIHELRRERFWIGIDPAKVGDDLEGFIAVSGSRPIDSRSPIPF